MHLGQKFDYSVFGLALQLIACSRGNGTELLCIVPFFGSLSYGSTFWNGTMLFESFPLRTPPLNIPLFGTDMKRNDMKRNDCVLPNSTESKLNLQYMYPDLAVLEIGNLERDSAAQTQNGRIPAENIQFFWMLNSKIWHFTSSG